MAYLLGVLVVVVGIGASIALHELGHLIPAKRFGVKCTQYMIGFGPTLWSRRIGETEYGLKAIPLGGYVRMLGMLPPKPDGAPRGTSTGRWATMIDQARQDSMAEVGPEDGDRLFYQRSVPKRLVIMFSGPAMNLVVAVVLMTGLLTLYGQEETTTTVGRVSACILPVDATAEATCTPSDQVAPAAAAGLKPGDVIVSVGGQSVSTWDQIRGQIRSHGNTALPVAIERAGQRQELTLTPILDKRKVYDDKTGALVKDENGQVVLEEVGFAGLTPDTRRQPMPLGEVPAQIGSGLVQTAGVIVRIPEKMVGLVQTVIGTTERDPNGPISVIGVGRLAGEVADAQSAPESEATWADRIAFPLSLIASLNMALFVFNLVPLLPLDGGTIAGALWEGLRRQVARLRRRPDPGPLDIARALPLTYLGASLLLGMFVLVMYADLVRPVKIGG